MKVCRQDTQLVMHSMSSFLNIPKLQKQNITVFLTVQIEIHFHSQGGGGTYLAALPSIFCWNLSQSKPVIIHLGNAMLIPENRFSL